ncbi:DNA adenine methylase [Pediococcus pentosaceus]|uniref:DNA adenine methylase n=1 Tax=Pediococcus pentosaceus TaxID=1255 RepID=UPI002073945A|nr:DNA adenine methylase [Pediococcus pentosaceus]MCM6791996.1 DNA adenine methylase [Pediococcus pentosaceus]
MYNLKPLFKYPGGKSREIKKINNFFPNNISTYVEPFVGGGAVYWSIEAGHYVINDISKELTGIYSLTAQNNPKFIYYMHQIADAWRVKDEFSDEVEANLRCAVINNSDEAQIGTFIKDFPLYNTEEYINFFEDEFKRAFNRRRKSLIKISLNNDLSNFDENALGILGGTLYTLNRYIYNQTDIENNYELKVALFYFLREYAYSSMFRFNSDGAFNVPFGGNTYAKKPFIHRIDQIEDVEVINKLKDTDIYTGDFEKIIKGQDKEGSFIFLDPPYDTEFSSYNMDSFDREDQKRLARQLKSIHRAKWMLVIKNTEFIHDLYDHPTVFIRSFDKSYSVNFKNRNDKNAEHLIITNYQTNTRKLSH